MDFEEWFEKYNYQREYTVEEYVTAQAAWDYQQKIIDGFKQANNDLAKAAIRPDGYVLVPVEPTEKMIDAWWDTHVDGDEEARWLTNYEDAEDESNR
jgi:hypothetical protein